MNGTLDKIELKWKPEASVCVVMASGGYPGNYRERQADPWSGRSGEIAAHKSFSRRHCFERRPNRDQWRSRSRRDRAGQGFEIRASRRLCRRGENPFRRRALPPRHRGEGFVGGEVDTVQFLTANHSRYGQEHRPRAEFHFPLQFLLSDLPPVGALLVTNDRSPHIARGLRCARIGRCLSRTGRALC